MLKKFRLLTIIGVLFFIYLPGFSKLQELKQRLNDAESEIRRVHRENYDLEQKIVSMRTDREALEIVAREKMGVVKKGETVLKIISEPAGQPVGNTTVF
jgi:cell division protein FtsB